jgi:hypothetical protein
MPAESIVQIQTNLSIIILVFSILGKGLADVITFAGVRSDLAHYKAPVGWAYFQLRRIENYLGGPGKVIDGLR